MSTPLMTPIAIPIAPSRFKSVLRPTKPDFVAENKSVYTAPYVLSPPLPYSPPANSTKTIVTSIQAPADFLSPITKVPYPAKIIDPVIKTPNVPKSPIRSIGIETGIVSLVPVIGLVVIAYLVFKK